MSFNQLTLSREKWGLYLITLFLLAFLINPASLLAQNGFPEPQDQYVNDFANMITPSDAAEITRLFQQLETEHGIQATVVTINSINDYPVGQSTIEGFATNLFNTWGIGDREANNGVLILVAVQDRLMRIELGSGYGNYYDSDMQEVINEFILPRFREEQYSLGLRRGALATIGYLTGEWPDEVSEPLSAVAPVTTSSTTVPAASPSSTSAFARLQYRIMSWIYGLSNEFGPVGILAVLGVGFIGIRTAVRNYLRYRPRACSSCGTQMVRLDETSDDLQLDSGQKLEEYLQAIDYDVWQCPGCFEHQLHRYPKLFSSYSKCPKCAYRTVKSDSRTLVAATYTSTGRKEVTKDCQHCDYYDVQTVTIPRKQRSSSSSGSSFSSGSSRSSRSSFGGGRSSGGGSSGKW